MYTAFPSAEIWQKGQLFTPISALPILWLVCSVCFQMSPHFHWFSLQHRVFHSSTGWILLSALPRLWLFSTLTLVFTLTQGFLLQHCFFTPAPGFSLQHRVNPSVFSSKPSAQPPGCHSPSQVLLCCQNKLREACGKWGVGGGIHFQF